MRRDPQLISILAGYRRLTMTIVTVLVVLGTVRALDYTGLIPAALLNLLPATTLLGGLVLVGLLLVGHRWLSRRLVAIQHTSEAARARMHRDALTGAFSRAYFLEALNDEVFHGSNRAVGYLHLDMDNLKVLNDTAGHAAGDAALVHLTQTIARVMPGAMVGRLGGDEFGIMIIGHDNKPALRRLGEQLLRQLDEPLMLGGRPMRLSASIGVALSPLDAVDADDLISKADLALYKGKKSGRHTVVAFDADMLGDERHRRFVERDLRAALLMDELELHYQPVFSADDMAVRSHEALVRWRHQVRGMIPPAEFVAIAEESDLIDKLGDWVLRRACLDLVALGTSVAVNVSPAQLRHDDFAQRFAAILAETNTDPRSIIVEVTETVPIHAGGVAMANLDALRATGIRIAIDDFGAGYASLQYLRGFAFDIIKIDRTYVASLGESRIDEMIIGAICDIARSLPVEVVAEGVETPEQLAKLKAAGCTAFQGYLLGRPASLAALQAERIVAA